MWAQICWVDSKDSHVGSPRASGQPGGRAGHWLNQSGLLFRQWTSDPLLHWVQLAFWSVTFFFFCLFCDPHLGESDIMTLLCQMIFYILSNLKAIQLNMLDTGALVGKREKLYWWCHMVRIDPFSNPECKTASLGQFGFLCCSNIINTVSFHSYTCLDLVIKLNGHSTCNTFSV